MWPPPSKEAKLSVVERQREYLRSKLNDEDHRIHAIAQLGGIVRLLKESARGVIHESFRTMDGTDCTQSVTKLQRCALVDPHEFKREIDKSLRAFADVGFPLDAIKMRRPVPNQIIRTAKRKKP